MCKLESLFILLLLFGKASLLNNGLARKPPMGWMSWGYYLCSVDCEKYPRKCLNEKLLLSVADMFYNRGYQEAGYEYIVIDDCWSEKRRSVNGRLVPDRKRFPKGMEAIAEYIHARGLKFGIYTNIADITCMHYPGSKGHFIEDAKMFAEWGVDYIKVDGCFVGEAYLNTAYMRFGQQLNNTGRPMVYSCSWPYYIEFIHKKTPDYATISRHCNMWRNYHDVVTSWDSIKDIIRHYQSSYDQLSPYHGPGHWNDMDMLDNSITLWMKPHLPRKGNQYHAVSFALVNLEDRSSSITFIPGLYGLNSTEEYTVMDVFTKIFIRNVTLNDSISVTVPSEDVILYTLFPL
ncbi:alpha-N-acetylgalactosaminidase-like isoform X2 [Pieris brassicae]|uniref:alpha-N-acetylgalactosaminidase-like isoform X2 n=1 Tax=Pieris brassicae TaxID=7116 RepID=UPI001E65E9AB|nr:alpha-N-acetylgalactosaminidase-like isoform X2 [Pieris brassicae]